LSSRSWIAGGSTTCGFEMSGCPGSGPASGSPGPRRSPRREAGLLRSLRTLADALPGSVGSGVVMPGWSGPSHWLHFSITAWLGWVWNCEQSSSSWRPRRTMCATPSNMLIESVCQNA
jgi:hypothetical protein